MQMVDCQSLGEVMSRALPRESGCMSRATPVDPARAGCVGLLIRGYSTR